NKSTASICIFQTILASAYMIYVFSFDIEELEEIFSILFTFYVHPTHTVGFLFPKLAYNSNSNNNKTITMKYVSLVTLLLSLTFAGCQEHPTEDVDPIATATAFENSDNILSKYLEKLDSEFTTQDV